MLDDRFLYLVRIVVFKLEVFMQPRLEAIVILFLLPIIILINIFFHCLLSQDSSPSTSSLEPTVIPTAQASSFTLQCFLF